MIDFHSHLDLYPDPERVVEECLQKHMFVLSVTNTPSAWEMTSRLPRGARRIRTALGLHPQLAGERKHELALFDQLLPQTGFVGEVGLDGSPEHRATWPSQLEVFEHILNACTMVGGRVLTIHSRRAASAVLDVLERYPKVGTVVMHWFSGSKHELERAVHLGAWFSVGPAMLSSSNGRKLLARMPKERVLPESDGPFAQLASKPLLPWDVSQAYELMSEIWAVPLDQVNAQMLVNLQNLAPSAGLQAASGQRSALVETDDLGL